MKRVDFYSSFCINTAIDEILVSLVFRVSLAFCEPLFGYALVDAAINKKALKVELYSPDLESGPGCVITLTSFNRIETEQTTCQRGSRILIAIESVFVNRLKLFY